MGMSRPGKRAFRNVNAVAMGIGEGIEIGEAETNGIVSSDLDLVGEETRLVVGESCGREGWPAFREPFCVAGAFASSFMYAICGLVLSRFVGVIEVDDCEETEAIPAKDTTVGLTLLERKGA